MKVCVIGSGISGIAAVRALQPHLPAHALHWISEDPEAGGLWSPSSRNSRAYDALYLNTTREQSAFTGRPIPAKTPVHYLHHSHYAAYLKEIAAECQGAERHWECQVTSVARHPQGGWAVHWVNPDGSVSGAEFDAVVDASGHTSEPRGPTVPVATNRTYAYTHSSAYRTPEPYRKAHVLVVGNGSSAVDIASDLVATSASVGISIRTPRWHLPKVAPERPVDHPVQGWLQRTPLVGRIVARIADSTVQRRLTDSYTHYGLPTPDRPLASSFPVLSDHFLSHLVHGRIRMYQRVTALGKETVQFGDGTAARFDAVIAATGFRDSSPHLPADVQQVLREGRLGLALQPPGGDGLFLMVRFRCGEAAVRCAEIQAAAVARAVCRPRFGTRSSPPGPASPVTSRITVRTLEKVYGAYR
ncbi:NAD(P)-binding domain-containing protein [Streptomyces sp. QH1-20]|uniref:NAD(P)-binding domain-containing protein n=1 Tax=Streptomyces sp. QH1-20 TaxID=3240934 RepID=UPI003514AB77